MFSWEQFASQIIDALKKYDLEHNTCYSWTLDDGIGWKVLADTMANVDRANKWEAIPTQAGQQQKEETHG